jgi:hypothetical protein
VVVGRAVVGGAVVGAAVVGGVVVVVDGHSTNWRPSKQVSAAAARAAVRMKVTAAKATTARRMPVAPRRSRAVISSPAGRRCRRWAG